MKYRVIIADDERKILQLIKKLGHWEKLGIEIVDECHNGQEALESILRHRPDIVLSDIKMPVYDGIRLIEKTREQGLDTFFILLSGYRHFEYARSAIQLNVMDYLLKPIDEAQLNDTLEKVCKRIDQKYKMEQLKELEAEHAKQKLQPFWNMLLFDSETDRKKYLSSVSVCNDKFGTNFREGCFQIIGTATNLNAMLEHEDSIFSDKIDTFIQRIFGENAIVYYYSTYRGRLIVLNYEEKDKTVIKDGVSALFCNIRALKDIYGDFQINFGCSSVKKNLPELFDAFMESEAAQWGKLIFMGNNIIEYNQIAHLKRFAVEDIVEKEELNRLGDSIRYLNREVLGEIFSALYQKATIMTNSYPGNMWETFQKIRCMIQNSLPDQGMKDRIEERCFYAYLEAKNFPMLIKNIYTVVDNYVKLIRNTAQAYKSTEDALDSNAQQFI